MNGVKVRVYRKVLKDISDNFGGVEEYINERNEEMCPHKKI